MARRTPSPHSALGPEDAPSGTEHRSATVERRRARRAEARLRLQRRRLAVTAVVLVAVLVGGAGMLDWWIESDDRTGERGEAGPPAPTSIPPAPDPTTPLAPPPTEPAPVLFEPSDFPTEGPGTFAFATGEGEVLGDSGTLRRFRVGVEDRIDLDPDELAVFVVDTLGHEQGWTAGEEVRLQLVPDGAGHDFTIYLVTSRTAGDMCAAAGLDVLGSGLPEGGVSCRAGGQVILNLSRWQLSVDEFVAAEVELTVYRQMLLNHEVGHELGYGHYACPGRGEPAPVMQQQSLGLDGCEANPWPYLDGVHHTGPPVA